MLLHDTTITTRTTAATTPTSDCERVRAAIARLAPAARDLLVLRFRDGLSTAELAAVAGTSVATVERRLHHAAWTVEDGAGPGDPAMLTGRQRVARPAELVVEDAAVGITPLLAARLTAAVSGPVPPPADDHWRWHALLEALRRHGEGAVTVALAAAVALPAVASLAT